MNREPHDFDALYASDEDPWQYRTRWYEERKRAITLACLPKVAYGSALEIGCSIGELTRMLAQRTTQMLACDISSKALEVARLRTASPSNIRFECMQVPDEWPKGSFDLIVLSEIAYYLSPQALSRTLSLIEQALNPGATFLTCHWRYPISGCVLDGDGIHQMLKKWSAQCKIHLLVEHVEEDFLLGVWSKDSSSVARREGLVETEARSFIDAESIQECTRSSSRQNAD